MVPDVAYLSYARVPFEDSAAADIPRVAPDAVVEILSPGDRRKDIDNSIRRDTRDVCRPFVFVRYARIG